MKRALAYCLRQLPGFTAGFWGGCFYIGLMMGLKLIHT